LVGPDSVARLRVELERIEAVLVRRTRNGATWPQIAAVMGVLKHAVRDGAHGLIGGRS
jgi:hypothetical protein